MEYTTVGKRAAMTAAYSDVKTVVLLVNCLAAQTAVKMVVLRDACSVVLKDEKMVEKKAACLAAKMVVLTA